jgi:hypothetical protein
MEAVNLLIEIAVHNGQILDFMRFGGPGRDRTDDLFHAMVGMKTQIIDGTTLMSRHNRQKRHNWHYLLPKRCQIYPAGQRADRVGSAQIVQPAQQSSTP